MARQVFLIAVLLCSFLGWAKVSLPMPTHYVEDKAGIVAANYEQMLNGLLQELEQKSGAQFIILTVNSTNGVPIDQYSIELVEQWKLGQEGKDNGLLFTVAYNDRKYRFEVGYGLEGFLTDQYTGRLGRDVLVPAMRQGQASEGIYQTALALANRIAKEYNIRLSGMPQGYNEPVGPIRQVRGTPCCCQLLPFIFVLFLILAGRGRGSFLWPLLFLMGLSHGSHRNPYDRNNRGYWGHGGGGFGGFGGGFGGRGGFGGFGGGRGGGFGGGGASGGW